MLRMSLAPCAPFVVTNDLMIKAAQMARKHPGVRLHTHLAENQASLWTPTRRRANTQCLICGVTSCCRLWGF